MKKIALAAAFAAGLAGQSASACMYDMNELRIEHKNSMISSFFSRYGTMTSLEGVKSVSVSNFKHSVEELPSKYSCSPFLIKMSGQISAEIERPIYFNNEKMRPVWASAAAGLMTYEAVEKHGMDHKETCSISASVKSKIDESKSRFNHLDVENLKISCSE